MEGSPISSNLPPRSIGAFSNVPAKILSPAMVLVTTREPSITLATLTQAEPFHYLELEPPSIELY